MVYLSLLLFLGISNDSMLGSIIHEPFQFSTVWLSSQLKNLDYILLVM